MCSTAGDCGFGHIGRSGCQPEDDRLAVRRRCRGLTERDDPDSVGERDVIARFHGQRPVGDHSASARSENDRDRLTVGGVAERYQGDPCGHASRHEREENRPVADDRDNRGAGFDVKAGERATD